MVKEKITIKIEQQKLALGHQSHQTGGGKHSDKRKRRLKNRSQKLKKILKEYE